MADDLNKPFVGYPSGRKYSAAKRRAETADVNLLPDPLTYAAMASFLGTPPDELGFSALHPKREAIKAVAEPAFYAGTATQVLPVLSALKARAAALPAGDPRMRQAGVIKPKGGNWLAGSVERAIEPMKRADPGRMTEEQLLRGAWENTRPLSESEQSMNRWLETKLAKYIKNEMGTPEDPIRALAERGVLHMEPYAIPQKPPLRLEINRSSQGFPIEGMGKSDAARFWEQMSDMAIRKYDAGDLTQRGIGGSGVEKYLEENPWLLKVPPETAVYDPFSGVVQRELGFGHLVDELKNAINPTSGLPENLRWKYGDLEKVTVPQAVQRVADINAWRAAQKAEADLQRAMNPATHTFKEYPEQGLKWVELKPAETLNPEYELKQAQGQHGSYWDLRKPGAPYGHTTKTEVEALRASNRQALEDALKYEGETMGHCVGGYCPDVLEGSSRIYSLRDKKGQPHVTIETRPMENYELEAAKMKRAGASPEEIAAFFENPPQEIVQIKGKANRAPNPEYLPAVQDFVRSGNWSKVGDLQNTGLISYKGEYRLPEEFLYRTDEGGWEPLVDVAKRAFPDSPAKQLGFYRGASELENDIKLKPQDEGFAEGGLVGGANFPTYDFDPARIDSIVGELHAMNAG